jgi:hypothetical protein
MPELMSDEQGGRSAWDSADHALKLKLLWLARIREYSDLTQDEDARRILGSNEIAEHVFDRWWTIRELEFAGSASDFVDYMKPFADKARPSGSELVDEWLSNPR